ncbi:flavin reductase family protein [Aquimarina hainanensis]|uniref:Flavin reductase family protein n=1 Tax=Aquimarina hainanensis TaxID=1578017 RepID=A0ABW5N7D2_9FLAO|nr:flavin reductase family protein [Aquimarina sp. TRL1]QKX05443.1 flavin reductase family protein [Aquimarina sp. TRL1]
MDTKKLRQVAGGFVTGITIVSSGDADEEVRAMTANSFLSVSLAPPLVLFSVDTRTRLFETLEKGKKITISILSEEQEEISNHFAGKNHLDHNLLFENIKNYPVIKNALGYYLTKVNQIIPAGDHYLVLCEVKDLYRNEQLNPLMYYSGGYKTYTKTLI